MASTNGADLVVRVAANIAALTSDMAAASASVKNIEGAIASAHAAGQGWMASLDGLGHSWVARIAEGELLRDAVREILAQMKELAEFFPELAVRGAVVGDVEESFKHLAEQAGHTSDVLLGTLRAGTHGTVDDFALMQRANKDLAAGLDLTDAQMGTLAQGAFALAKATGTDTKNALDTMSDAMVTGKAKAVALLTGKIDLKAAEDAFAASLGVTKDELTAEGKLEADREAILAGVERGLARVGEQHDSLKDKVDQDRAAWANFEDDLGKTIAQSPVLAAGFDTLRVSLLNAFGGDQKTLIDNIAHAVVDAAIVVVDFGIGATTMAGVVVQVWYGIQTAVLGVETVIVGLVTALGEVLLAADKMAGKLHLVDDSEVAKMQATQDGLRAITVGLAAETAEAARNASGHSALIATLDKATGALLNTRDAMIKAQAAQGEQTAATAAFVGPLQEVNDGLKKHGDYVGASASSIKEFNKAVLEVESAGIGWKGTLDSIDGAVVESMRDLTAAGVSIKALEIYYGLTATQGKAFTDMLKDEEIQTKQNERAWFELQKASDEYYKAVNAAGHDSTQRQIDDAYLAASARIDAMVKAKAYSVEAEMLIWKAAEQTANNIIQKTLESDVHSKAHFEKVADDARIAYEFAQAHADQYTADWIIQLQKTADAAKLAADTFGTSFDQALGKVDAHIATTISGFHQLEMASAVGRIGTGDGIPDSMEKRLARFAEEQAQHPGVFISPVGLFDGLPGHANGIEDNPVGHWAMVGEKGPEPMYVPQGASIRQAGSGVPGGGSPIQIYITQPLGTPAAIAAAVDQALVARKKNIGQRF